MRFFGGMGLGFFDGGVMRICGVIPLGDSVKVSPLGDWGYPVWD